MTPATNGGGARGPGSAEFCGERGDSRMVGWQGEIGTTDFSSLGRKPCFPTGSISVADSRTLPASCKEKEGGSKKLKTEKGWRCKSRVLYPNLLYLAIHVFEKPGAWFDGTSVKVSNHRDPANWE